MATPSPSPSPTHESEANMSHFENFDSDATIHHINIHDDEPLYTEINIPLPRLPTPPPQTPASPSINRNCLSPPPTHSRSRSRSLSSFSLFRPRSSSTSSSQTSQSIDVPDRLVKPSILKSREVAAAMNLGHQSKRGRSSTVDALAVVPAVLVLSAELFTPGSKGGKMRGGLR
jgi:hypothetical protein